MLLNLVQMDRLYVTFVIIYRYGPYYDLVMEFHSTTSNHLIISNFYQLYLENFCKMIAIQIGCILQEHTASSTKEIDFFLPLWDYGFVQRMEQIGVTEHYQFSIKQTRTSHLAECTGDHIVIHHNWEKSSTFYGSSKIEASLETIYHNQIPITKYPVRRNSHKQPSLSLATQTNIPVGLKQNSGKSELIAISNNRQKLCNVQFRCNI